LFASVLGAARAGREEVGEIFRNALLVVFVCLSVCLSVCLLELINYRCRTDIIGRRVAGERSTDKQEIPHSRRTVPYNNPQLEETFDHDAEQMMRNYSTVPVQVRCCAT
jgi:hypothetical protein